MTAALVMRVAESPLVHGDENILNVIIKGVTLCFFVVNIGLHA